MRDRGSCRWPIMSVQVRFVYAVKLENIFFIHEQSSSKVKLLFSFFLFFLPTTYQAHESFRAQMSPIKSLDVSFPTDCTRSLSLGNAHGVLFYPGNFLLGIVLPFQGSNSNSFLFIPFCARKNNFYIGSTK